ncbi:hypothetical protein ACILFN_05805 [Capnocytophaga canimorsus]|uniref:hypothetical protein n=1 Tax=Capnocytophaga canimorsus TaxID=28188 RepID=UPI0037CF5222
MQAIKNKYGKILAYIVAILYVSDIPFFFLPFSVRTRFFLGLLGIFIFFTYYVRNRCLDKRVWNNILWLLALLLPFLLTTIVNSNLDSWGFRAVLNVLVLFAAFLVIHLFKKTDIEAIFRIIINVVLINIILAYLMFFFSPMKDFVFRLQGLKVDLGAQEYYTSTYRLYGIGNFFFYQAGVFCSWILILITYFLKKKVTLHMVFTYFFVLISGIFFARTTFIGFVISALYYLFPNAGTVQVFRQSFLKAIFLVFTLLILFSLSQNMFRTFLLDNKDDKMFAHAFEFFLSFYEDGKFETDSTNHLSEMYIYPEYLRTWLIGDGKFVADGGVGYYMGTDVGYLRVLFFMGLFGLFVMYLQKIFLLYSTFKLKKIDQYSYKLLIYFLFGLTLILNLKGFTDLDMLVFLFFWQLLLNKEVVYNENINR